MCGLFHYFLLFFPSEVGVRVRIYTLSASDAFWLFKNSTFPDTFVTFQAALSRQSGCLRCCFCLYCLSWVVRKHYPDSCFCCCFFLIESSSLKPVLRGHKNKYDFGPVAVARDESATAHKSPFMDKGMLQYLLLSDTEPLPFITMSFITTWVFFFFLLHHLALSTECDPVNANKQLSAFVIQKQRHLAIVSPPSCFCATNPKQMDVCTVLTVHTVPCIEARTIARLSPFIPYFVGFELCWEHWQKCLTCGIRSSPVHIQDFFFFFFYVVL